MFNFLYLPRALQPFASAKAPNAKLQNRPCFDVKVIQGLVVVTERDAGLEGNRLHLRRNLRLGLELAFKVRNRVGPLHIQHVFAEGLGCVVVKLNLECRLLKR